MPVWRAPGDWGGVTVCSVVRTEEDHGGAPASTPCRQQDIFTSNVPLHCHCCRSVNCLVLFSRVYPTPCTNNAIFFWELWTFSKNSQDRIEYYILNITLTSSARHGRTDIRHYHYRYFSFHWYWLFLYVY